MTVIVIANMTLLTDAPSCVPRLRALIRDLAVTGRLVHRSPGTSSWQWSTLGEQVSGMDSGWSPSCLDAPSPKNDVWGVLRTTAVQPLRYVQDENKELPTKLTPRPEAEVKAGDVLFTRAGPMNRVGISCLVETTRPRLMLSDKIIRFRPRAERLDGKFTALCLNAGTTARYLESAKSGMAASQVNISQAKLRTAPIPIPPLAEQHRIVAKVDELMALCDRLEARQQDAEAAHAQLVQSALDSLTQARNADDFRASWLRLARGFDVLFSTDKSIEALKLALRQLALSGRLVPPSSDSKNADDLVTELTAYWRKRSARKVSLGSVSDSEKRYPVPSSWVWLPFGFLAETRLGKMLDAAKNTGSLKRYLRNTNVQWDRFELEDLKELRLEPAELGEYSVRSGDLLICEGGEPGRCAVWTDDTREVYFQKALHRARPLAGILSDYLKICLRVDAETGELARLFTGATIKHLTGEKLEKYVVPVPPPAEQRGIVSALIELISLCDQLKARIAAARAKQAQLAEALVAQAVEA